MEDVVYKVLMSKERQVGRQFAIYSNVLHHFNVMAHSLAQHLTVGAVLRLLAPDHSIARAHHRSRVAHQVDHLDRLPLRV